MPPDTPVPETDTVRETGAEIPAIWITFEGIEGCGKTTQLQRLAERLRRLGSLPVVTREPGGTPLGRSLRHLLLDPRGPAIDPAAEVLLYTADRAQHLAEVILPGLQSGRPVLCDRYLDATLAYQGYGRGLALDAILNLHRHAPLDRRPDRTLLLDLDVDEALSRARKRNRRGGSSRGDDRMEREDLDFHRKVRDGYLELSAGEPERFRVLDATGGIDLVAQRVVGVLADAIPALRKEP